MRSSRLWRVSSFHFLSLHRLGDTAQILQSCFLAAPSPEAREAVSFRLEDVLYTTASDSEESSGQEAWPSLAYTELVDVLACSTEKLSLDWTDKPHESQSSKLNECFLSGSISRLDFQVLKVALLPPH